MATPVEIKLAEERLQQSGLEGVSLASLHMEVLTATETDALAPHFPKIASLLINYMDPFTNQATAQPMRHRPLWPGFKRIRILGPAPMDTRGKPLRYMQSTGIGVCAYFPTCIDWMPVLNDTQRNIFITEGEFKAIKACHMGYPTIGLGGVSNITSRKTGVDLLPELKRINWVQRNVYICFDNDGAPNPNVLHAINTLAQRLEEEGAIVWLIQLPDHPKGLKMGLDDFFLTHQRKDFDRLIAAAESMTLARPLWAMNETAVKIMAPMSVVDMRTFTMLKVEEFKSHFGNQRVPEQLLTKDGEMSLKRVNLAERWLAWPWRRSALGMTYAPGQPLSTDKGMLNVWRGWGVDTPVKGDVSMFNRLLDYFFGSSKEGKVARKWFTQWLAYPLQHPGAKLYTACLLWSALHGTGKTLMGYTMEMLYGKDNFAEITQKNMHGDFNGWAQNKSFVLCDEITGSDKREVADQIKSLVTSHTIRINQKHIAEYSLPNVCNFLLTSNRATALYLEKDDRRFFVWEVQEKAPEAFFNAYDIWYRDPINQAALMHHLLSLDLTGFDPTRPAPYTEAKERMAEDGMTAAASYCKRLKDDPDYYLRHGKSPIEGDLHTAHDLLALFEQEGPTQMKANFFGTELRAAGFQQLPQMRWGTPSRRDRFFIIRNEEMWLHATPAQIRKHIEYTKEKKV